MKIFILNVPKFLQPKKQKFKYPRHNRDYGIEQDLLGYFNKNECILTNDPGEADFHYLPVFWSRLYINNDYASKNMMKIKEAVYGTIIQAEKTFTICSYDDGPLLEMDNLICYLSCPKIASDKIVPLLCDEHVTSPPVREKYFKASFIGRFGTSKFRENFLNSIKTYEKHLLLDGEFGTKNYVNVMRHSEIALCPRGYGSSSYRFYEAMQLGTVPVLVGDIDIRPFKALIPWAECSFWAKSVAEYHSILHNLNPQRALVMGRIAKGVYDNLLGYQKWCELLMIDLNSRKKRLNEY